MFTFPKEQNSWFHSDEPKSTVFSHSEKKTKSEWQNWELLRICLQELLSKSARFVSSFFLLFLWQRFLTPICFDVTSTKNVVSEKFIHFVTEPFKNIFVGRF